MAWLGDSHILDALLEGVGFASERKDFTVGTQQMGRRTKNLVVMVQAGLEVGIGWGTR